MYVLSQWKVSQESEVFWSIKLNPIYFPAHTHFLSADRCQADKGFASFSPQDQLSPFISEN